MRKFCSPPKWIETIKKGKEGKSQILQKIADTAISDLQKKLNILINKQNEQNKRLQRNKPIDKPVSPANEPKGYGIELEKASAISRGVEGTGMDKQKRIGYINKQESAALEKHAKESGLWVEDYEKEYGVGDFHTKGGNESLVFINKDSKSVIKVNNGINHNSCSVFNLFTFFLFPNTSASVTSLYLKLSLSLVFSRLAILPFLASISKLTAFCLASFVFSEITLPFLSKETITPPSKYDIEPSWLKSIFPALKPPSDVFCADPPTTSPVPASALYFSINPNFTSVVIVKLERQILLTNSHLGSLIFW